MPIVCNELLGRELIKIYQDTDAFNFSIDSMLLADFVTITARTKNICDLCTGNAPIPLYLTLRTKANIVGVEVQEHSYDLAFKSIKVNHLENQITVIHDNLIDISRKIIVDYRSVISNMNDYILEFESIRKNESFTKSLMADVKDENINLESLIDLYINRLKDLNDVKDLNVIRGVFDISESTNIVSEDKNNNEKLELQKISKNNLTEWQSILTKLYDELLKKYSIKKNSMEAFYSFDIQNDNPKKLGYNCKLLMAKISFIYELPIYDTIKLRIDIYMQYNDMPGFDAITRDELSNENKDDLDLVEKNMKLLFNDIDDNAKLEELFDGFTTIKYRNVKTFKITDNNYDEIKKYLNDFMTKLSSN